ncbi:MAG: imidazole glycerol phosphate synthase subunit HisH [Chitinophagaceae bacterium]|nr:MAG: imidazole glycerol phosphate synthase subunit HisH [Chitinophagaceae bacterium]
MNIVIIKYNAGNIRSVLYSLERIGIEATVTDNIEEIQQADKVIFPGVGEASTAMNYLRAHQLDKVIRDLNQPVLGICLGMQLLCKHSEENDAACLGIFDLQVKKFSSPRSPLRGDAGGLGLKIPQIGWNDIYDLKSPLFNNVEEHTYVYFVHSYYVEKSDAAIAIADYGLSYSAAIHKDNFYAVQFHPEKSATAGESIIKNFIQL